MKSTQFCPYKDHYLNPCLIGKWLYINGIKNWNIFTSIIQGCSLGLDVSVSRRSFQTSRSRLGLVETWEGLGLDLVSDWKSNVSVSYHRVSFTSQCAQLFASLQNCTYIVLNARRLYCLLIHKFTISRCHLVRIYGSAQATLCTLHGNPVPPSRGTAAHPQFSARVYFGKTIAHLSYCWVLVI